MFVQLLAQIKSLQDQGRAQGNMAESMPRILSAVEDCFDAICDMPGENRIAALNQITDSESNFLLGVARSMAHQAVNDQSGKWLKYGLLALMFENLHEDDRVTIIELCLLDHSAKKLDEHLHERFNDIAAYGTNKVVELIKSYFGSGGQNIHSMRYEECYDDNGFRYKQISGW